MLWKINNKQKGGSQKLTTDDYLSEISKRSNKFGSQLNKLMDFCGVNCLADVSYDMAKMFYEKLVRENIDDSI